MKIISELSITDPVMKALLNVLLKFKFDAYMHDDTIFIGLSEPGIGEAEIRKGPNNQYRLDYDIYTNLGQLMYDGNMYPMNNLKPLLNDLVQLKRIAITFFDSVKMQETWEQCPFCGEGGTGWYLKKPPGHDRCLDHLLHNGKKPNELFGISMVD